MKFLCKNEVTIVDIKPSGLPDKNEDIKTVKYKYIKDKWYEGYKKGLVYCITSELGEEEIPRGIMEVIFELDPVKLREYKINKILK